MKNLKTFEIFNENRRPSEDYNNFIDFLINSIKESFDILELYEDSDFTIVYVYTHKSYKIKVSKKNIIIDNNDITNYVDEHYIKELFYFFHDKYKILIKI